MALDSKHKIKRETLSSKLEQILRKKLIQGEWKEGERLPTESELAQIFGVSRTTVRVAIQKLDVQGLVEIRQGDGIFAKQFSIRSYIKKAGEVSDIGEVLEDVCDFRKSLEIECVRLAIQRADEKDFAEMQKCLDRYTYIRRSYPLSCRENIARYVEADLDFHYTLCKAAHNSLMLLAFNAAREAIYNYLCAIIQRRLEKNLTTYLTTDDLDVHQLTLNALCAKDFERCRILCETMIDYKLSEEEYGQVVDAHAAVQKDQRYRAERRELI